jgi:hypothetical protein
LACSHQLTSERPTAAFGRVLTFLAFLFGIVRCETSLRNALPQ